MLALEVMVTLANADAPDVACIDALEVEVPTLIRELCDERPPSDEGEPCPTLRAISRDLARMRSCCSVE